MVKGKDEDDMDMRRKGAFCMTDFEAKSLGSDN